MSKNLDALPSNLDAERSVLQALTYNKTLLGQASAKIKSEYFYHESCQIFFETLLEQFSKGLPVDAISMSDVLERKHMLDKVGGVGEVTDLCCNTGMDIHYGYHLQIIRDQWVLRRAIQGCQFIIQGAKEPVIESTQIREVAERAGKFAAEIAQDINSIESKDESWEDQVLKFEHKFHSAFKGQRQSSLPSRWKKLNNAIGGIPKALITISAPEKRGKTNLALNLARDIVGREDDEGKNIGEPGIFFTQEMPDTELISRMIADVGDVEGQYIFAPDRARPTREMLMNIVKASDKIREWPFKVIHNPEITLEQMDFEISKMIQLHGRIGFIAADYLQLYPKPRGLEKNATREREISELTRRFKIMQGKYDAVFLLLCQQNADGSFRESRAIGMHTHMALQLNDDGLLVKLNRNGPAGDTIPLIMDGPKFRFKENSIL